MNIQEFAPIHHNNLPIKTFILSNNGYLLIRSPQKNFMGRYIGEGPETGIWCPDTAKIVAAYEIPYFKIDNVNKIEETVKKVFVTKGLLFVKC